MRNVLQGKRILLGITGSIAAYKSAYLVRELIVRGAEVKVICTPSALDFVTPLTLSTLSKNPVHSEFIANRETGEWVNHVALGKWADLLVIAPLSASTLSKMSTGHCDNLLLATYLSADCPVLVAPAMDLDMHKHWSTQQNLDQLAQHDTHIIEATEGELDSGLFGKGRMAEPEDIAQRVEEIFSNESVLANKQIVITAGPTYEKLDPVRFIGNHSSGRMGIAIANEACARGAKVTLICGPSALSCDPGIQRIDVVSAHEMYEAVSDAFKGADVLIMAAAVADFTPKNVFESKQKKETSKMNSIELVPTRDILREMGAKKKNTQFVVGFALETDNELKNAHQKLENKNLDMLVLNSLKDDGAGFGTDTNKITFVFKDGHQPMELKSKEDVAKDILNELENRI
ncbi:MAG: bifunctional phosphopantothenoylcysteine decarboxylase/phosphopantothenate--cysteine ligase CoaBC [Salibacteraceae bacterium]